MDAKIKELLIRLSFFAEDGMADKSIVEIAKQADALLMEHVKRGAQQQAGEPVAWLHYPRKKPELMQVSLSKRLPVSLKNSGWVSDPLYREQLAPRAQLMRVAEMVMNATSRHLCGGDPVPELAAIVDAFQPQAEPLLDKPASVGGLRFHAGVPIRLLVEAAQRRYEHEESPEGKAEQKRKSDELLAKVTAPLMPQPEPVNQQMLAEVVALLESHQKWMNKLPVPTTGATHQMMNVVGKAIDILNDMKSAGTPPKSIMQEGEINDEWYAHGGKVTGKGTCFVIGKLAYHKLRRSISAEASQAQQPADGVVDAEPSQEWWNFLIEDISAIDCRYRGDPSYDHDAYWMRERVMKKLEQRRDAALAAHKAQGGGAE